MQVTSGFQPGLAAHQPALGAHTLLCKAQCRVIDVKLYAKFNLLQQFTGRPICPLGPKRS